MYPEEIASLKEAVIRSGGSGQSSGKFLEIGTAAGGTLVEMMRSFDDKSRPPFEVIDPMTYFPDQLETVKKNLRDNGLDPDSVKFNVSKSKDAFLKAEARGERYDFILIDGAHKIRYVTQDLSWGRLLNVGGLICLHDYHPNHRGIMMAAERFLRKYPNYERESLAGTLLTIRKREESKEAEIETIDLIWANLWSLFFQLKRNFDKHLSPLFGK